MKQQRSPKKVAPAKPVARPVARPIGRGLQSPNGDQNSVPAKPKLLPKVELAPTNNRHRKKPEQDDVEAQYTPGKLTDEQVQRLFSLFKELEPREREILVCRFGLDGRRPKTLAEVGMMCHRSGERIRQIQNVALAKIRAMIEDEKESASEAEESD